MTRRAHWLAAAGSATLGLAGLAGCQSMGGYPTGSWNGDRSMVRAAEPDDQSEQGSLQLRAIQSAAADDPFAPITVEQLLPASSTGPRGGTSANSSYNMAPAGYNSTPSSSAPNAMVPPAPMAVMTPAGPSPLMSESHSWGGHGALHGGCSQCGQGSGGCSTFSGMVENMVIFIGADYFNNSGQINRDRLFNKALNTLAVIPVDVPDLDPQRTGGMFSLNAGAPFTADGEIGFQIGGTYVESEEGAQGFFTTGFFHRCQAGSCPINWGAVFDIAYDDFIDYCIGQFRFKAGYAVTSRDEIGGWLSVGTNTEHVFLSGTDVIDGDPTLTLNDNVIEARVRPECNGYIFWRHVMTSGCEGTFFMGGRENLGGSFILGYTAQLPMSDCCSILSGGHWSQDSDDRGSYDVYIGLGYYPGGNARSTGACGNRFLPYQEAANNNVMPMSINPRQLILLGVPPGPGSHVPL
jgi:hypothetical protein